MSDILSAISTMIIEGNFSDMVDKTNYYQLAYPYNMKLAITCLKNNVDPFLYVFLFNPVFAISLSKEIAFKSKPRSFFRSPPKAIPRS